MKDAFGHGSDPHGTAMRGLKLASISKHRSAHPNHAVFTKLRSIRNSNGVAAKQLREGSGHKSNPVGTHAAMGGAYAFGKADSGNGY